MVPKSADHGGECMLPLRHQLRCLPQWGPAQKGAHQNILERAGRMGRVYPPHSPGTQARAAPSAIDSNLGTAARQEDPGGAGSGHGPGTTSWLHGNAAMGAAATQPDKVLGAGITTHERAARASPRTDRLRYPVNEHHSTSRQLGRNANACGWGRMPEYSGPTPKQPCPDTRTNCGDAHGPLAGTGVWPGRGQGDEGRASRRGG